MQLASVNLTNWRTSGYEAFMARSLMVLSADGLHVRRWSRFL